MPFELEFLLGIKNHFLQELSIVESSYLGNFDTNVYFYCNPGSIVFARIE
jgi:hypothetical protein